MSASIYFDGNNDYLNVIGTNSQLEISAAQNFTLEMFVYFATGAATDLYDARPASTNGFYIYLTKNASEQIVFHTNSANQITSTNAVALNTWHHIALVRTGAGAQAIGTTKLYVNGYEEGVLNIDANSYINGTNRPVIGAGGFTLGNNDFAGYISNLRLVVGTAVYTSNFSPPTRKLTNITNTQLLLANDNAVGNIRDNSSNNFGITVTGTPIISLANPFSLSNYMGEGLISSEDFNSQENNDLRNSWRSSNIGFHY